jgi:altronate dehydratase
VTIRVLVLRLGDNVAVALEHVPAGTVVSVGNIKLRALDAIPQGHKISLSDLAEDAPVIKYGSEIGRATKPIARGAHVHVHNIESARLRGDL